MEEYSPAISIILPTYNGGAYIASAIESVQAQTYTNWELLIIDDGSSDDTKNIVYRFSNDARIVYMQNEKNLGIQKTLNKGLYHARGVYIARIDADDKWNDTEKLAKQYAFFENNPEYVLVGTGLSVVDTTGMILSSYIPPVQDEDIRRRILGQTCFAHSSVLFKKDPVLSRGGYGESKRVRHVEDYDLWLYLGTVGKFANIPEISIMLMVHESSITSKNRIYQAYNAFRTALRYVQKYPRGIWGLVVAFCRLIFFALRSIIPLPKKWVYVLQAFVKKA